MSDRQVSVTWYDDPSDAERDLMAEYRAMTPQERVDECVRLMCVHGGWSKDTRIARVARFVDVNEDTKEERDIHVASWAQGFSPTQEQVPCPTPTSRASCPPKPQGG